MPIRRDSPVIKLGEDTRIALRKVTSEMTLAGVLPYRAPMSDAIDKLIERWYATEEASR